MPSVRLNSAAQRESFELTRMALLLLLLLLLLCAAAAPLLLSSHLLLSSLQLQRPRHCAASAAGTSSERQRLHVDLWLFPTACRSLLSHAVAGLCGCGAGRCGRARRLRRGIGRAAVAALVSSSLPSVHSAAGLPAAAAAASSLLAASAAALLPPLHPFRRLSPACPAAAAAELLLLSSL